MIMFSMLRVCHFVIAHFVIASKILVIPSLSRNLFKQQKNSEHQTHYSLIPNPCEARTHPIFHLLVFF